MSKKSFKGSILIGVAIHTKQQYTTIGGLI